MYTRPLRGLAVYSAYAACRRLCALRTGLNGNHAGKAYRDLTARYPDVHCIGVNFRFPGRGQRGTPVANVRGIVEIIMMLPGQQTAHVRRQAVELLCRYLGGDVILVDEICAMLDFQEQFAVQAPEDPRCR